jgi:glycopeptide antibiotics resistance protein
MELDFDILIWFIGIFILFLILVILWRQKKNPYHLILFSIFWVYILLLLKETLFPIPLTRDLFDDMREFVPFMSRVNLIPFNFGLFVSLKGIIITSILNIILTMPFGFGVGFIWRLGAKNFWGLSTMVGGGIEVAQLIISLSVNSRTDLSTLMMF